MIGLLAAFALGWGVRGAIERRVRARARAATFPGRADVAWDIDLDDYPLV